MKHESGSDLCKREGRRWRERDKERGKRARESKITLERMRREYGEKGEERTREGKNRTRVNRRTREIENE